VPRSAARAGWIETAPEPAAEVTWSEAALRAIPESAQRTPAGMPAYSAAEVAELVQSLVALDPRPAHERGRRGDWAMRLLGFDVKIHIDGARATIVALD
jgi:hypothetical protein